MSAPGFDVAATDREGQQRVVYDPFAKPPAGARSLREPDCWNLGIAVFPRFAVLYLVLFQLERPPSKKRLAFSRKESMCVDVRGR